MIAVQPYCLKRVSMKNPAMLIVMAGLSSVCGASPIAAAAPQQLALARDISELTNDQVVAFTQADKRRAHDCSGHRDTLENQIFNKITIPDRPFGRVLEGGDVLYSGGMPHDFGDSAALLYDANGRLVAAAVMGCELNGRGERRPENFVYVDLRNDKNKQRYLRQLRHWRGYGDNATVRRVFHVR
jgi:hypothetical protein